MRQHIVVLAFGILAAVESRHKTGRGQMVETSLPRGNVLLALMELPRKERGGGPSGVVEMFVRDVGGSCDGVVLFGGLTKK